MGYQLVTPERRWCASLKLRFTTTLGDPVRYPTSAPMNRFFRFLWNDALTYLSASLAVVGVIVVLRPVDGMPNSYGFWVLGLGGMMLACRIAKSAALLSFGSHTRPKILDKYVGYHNVAKIKYSFKTETATVLGKCQLFDQQNELMVAYWRSYPTFHIAYWTSNEHANAG
ncbi:MAG: hypothetical protein AAGA30_11040 [Planctomycetota bacterium]